MRATWVNASNEMAVAAVSTATAFWGWGLHDQVDSSEVNVTSPLAVLIASFSATQAGRQALLTWETISLAT